MRKNATFSQHLGYFTLRVFTSPFRLMPYWMIHALGRALGTIVYYMAPKRLKKITYNNLALAKDLKLSEEKIKSTARHSFQNLVINALLYFKLKGSRGRMDRFVTGVNLGPFHELLDKGQGVIAVTGHISNWELCFLHHTQTRPGYAIGKPIRNSRIYRYIQSIREMHLGKVIDMQHALKEGIKILRAGGLFTMVNDQSFTSSIYSYPFFGVRAWTSPSPALLAYRSKCPIVVATTVRKSGGKYEYHVSDPIWPNRANPIKEELPRLMDQIMSRLERHIAKYPDQWLWQHRRWKQEGFHRVFRQYKADSILFILPKDPELFKKVNKGLPILNQIYRRSFLTFMVPKEFENEFSMKDHETLTYEKEEEARVRDYRFQLVFDFLGDSKISKHYLKLGASRTFNLSELLGIINVKVQDKFDMRDSLIRTLCLPGTPFY